MKQYRDRHCTISKTKKPVLFQGADQARGRHPSRQRGCIRRRNRLLSIPQLPTALSLKEPHCRRSGESNPRRQDGGGSRFILPSIPGTAARRVSVLAHLPHRPQRCKWHYCTCLRRGTRIAVPSSMGLLLISTATLKCKSPATCISAGSSDFT